MAKSKCRAGGGGKARTGRQSALKVFGGQGLWMALCTVVKREEYPPPAVKFVSIDFKGIGVRTLCKY